jgi:AcrR family transcriptional regulator
MANVGRPREHDERTGALLLAAAERVVEAEGQQALSLRRIAVEAKTTTRAVYSLFGSADALRAALGARAFLLLGAGVEALARSDDPIADLVEAGLVFRQFATAHRALFGLAVQMTQTSPSVATRFRSARGQALASLRARIERLEARGLLGGRSVREAVFAFHALCEGLAAVELRHLMPQGEEADLWRSALTALVTGFAGSRPTPRGRSKVVRGGAREGRKVGSR